MNSITSDFKLGFARNYLAMVFMVVLVVVLLLSAWLRIQLGYRAGHMDEYDYLFIGKTLLDNLHWPTHSYVFGADLSWYLLGAGDKYLGGLNGARAIAAVFGALSLAGIYLFCKELWQCQRTALLATALLGISAGHIFISRLASYDAISFAFFSLAMMPLLRASLVHRPTIHKTIALDVVDRETVIDKTSFKSRSVYLLAGVTLLIISVLTKYITVVYLPFIVLTMMLLSPVIAVLATVLIGAALATYAALHWSELLVLYEVQIVGVHGATSNYADVLSMTIKLTLLPLIFCIMGLLSAQSAQDQDKRVSTTHVTLLIFACPMVCYHLLGQNLISLYKHLNFALYFLSVSSAWWLTTCFSHYQRKYLFSPGIINRAVPVAIVALIIVHAAYNQHQLRQMESGYPNVEGLTQHLQQRDVTPNILSEDPYLFRYLNYSSLQQNQIAETSWLDNDLDGTHTHQDVIDALWDRKFNTVLLNDAIHPERNTEYRKILALRDYKLEYSEPYSLSKMMTTHQKGEINLYVLTKQSTLTERN